MRARDMEQNPLHTIPRRSNQCYNFAMRFAKREKHAIAHSPKIIMAVEQWLDGQIGIQDFIDLTGCTTTSAYSSIARGKALVII